MRIRRNAAWLLLAAAALLPQAHAAPNTCTPAQAAEAALAQKQARAMLQKVIELIDSGDSIALERMQTWLGIVNTTQSQEVKARLNKTWAWLGGATFLCDMDFAGYAWVYADQAFAVRLGQLFFTAPTAGHSSKAGTLVHEVTHFLLAGASADPPTRLYGEKEALERAKKKPAEARVNAENLEYFIESTFHGMTP